MGKRAILAAFTVAALATFIAAQGAGARVDAKGSAAAATGCQLNSARGNIKHVIYIQFDNTHLRRDNANVPSDLQQMPHLLNFITGNGTMMANDHTALISHTATGILTSLTGVYPDRMGQPVSNSFRYFTPSGGSRTGVAFAYWTARSIKAQSSLTSPSSSTMLPSKRRTVRFWKMPKIRIPW